MSAPDFDWLHQIASTDDLTVTEAAAALVANGVSLTGKDWRELGTAGRAALTVARRMVEAEAMRARGADLAADVSLASLDGGRAAARNMARAAAQGVARALQQRREAAGG